MARSLSPVQQLVGIEKLQDLLEDREGATMLRTDYRFDLPAFSRLLGELPHFNSAPVNFSALFFDTGDGFNEESLSRTRVNLLCRKFDITFDLSGAPTVRQLRWDPFAGQLGRVHVAEMVWRTPEGSRGGGCLKDFGQRRAWR